jgi:tetratricopeptide (TPR) repeat protein
MVWNNLGVCYYNLENYQEARKSYDKALEVERYEKSLKKDANEGYVSDVEAHRWFLKGNLLRKLRKYDKARDCYDESLKINSTDTGAWLNKGLCFYNSGEYEEARNSYRKALEMESDTNTTAEVWNNLGVCSFDLGDFEEARKSYDRAIEIDPNNAKPWYNKYKLGGRDAQKCLNKAKELGLDLDSLI